MGAEPDRQTDDVLDERAQFINPEAPWGYKKDGTPRKKPGSPKGTNNGGGRRPTRTTPVVHLDGAVALSLTPEVAETIIDALLNGCTRREAAYLAGVKPVTFELWMRNGDDGEGPEPYSSFAFAVNRAIVISGGKLRDPIRRSALKGNTADAKWLLQNHPEHRDEFGERKQEGAPVAPMIVLAFPGERQIEGAAHVMSIPAPEATEAEVVDDP